MHIKKTIEGPDGIFEINGEFTAEEIAIILEVGLNTLYATGALPFTAINKEKLAQIAPYSEEPQ